MNADEAKSTLGKYEAELTRILGRFKRTEDGIHIHGDDDPRFRQLVIELRDFLDDALGPNTYSKMIVNFFNEGTANFTGSPSYKSVENIRGVVSSLITRVERKPEILSMVKDSTPSAKEPDLPEKVTLVWLARHVPVRFWVTLLGLLGTSFVLGIQASRLSLIQEIFGLQGPKPIVQEVPKSAEDPVKAKPVRTGGVPSGQRPDTTESTLAVLARPVPKEPECGSVIPISAISYGITFNWEPVDGASTYTVEVDCFGCSEYGRYWHSLAAGRSWHIRTGLGVRSPIYSSRVDKLIRDADGYALRWRVWGVNHEGKEGRKSDWCQFAFSGKW